MVMNSSRLADLIPAGLGVPDGSVPYSLPPVGTEPKPFPPGMLGLVGVVMLQRKISQYFAFGVNSVHQHR